LDPFKLVGGIPKILGTTLLGSTLQKIVYLLSLAKGNF